MSKKIVTNYKPRPYQQFLHDNCERFTVAVCHRRFGKSMWAINHILRKAFTNPLKNAQYMYIAPEKSQCKDIAWAPLKSYLRGIPGVTIKEAELRVEIDLAEDNKIVIVLRGADNPDSLRGMYLDGVVVDEVSDFPRSAWDAVLRPALSDRKGWAVFVGTPKGKNYFRELYLRGLSGRKGWVSYLMPASVTKVIDEEELLSCREDMGDELFQQEYECSFEASIPGSYYGKLLADLRSQNKIHVFEPIKEAKVITAWDIGMNDKTCIWFAQRVGKTIKIIDYYENNGEILSHYVNVVKARGYDYDYHILPHDVNQRNWSSGETRLSEIERSGLKCRVAPKLPIDDGIHAVRSILPLCEFHEVKCDAGLSALSYYHSKYNDRKDVKQLAPEHDWSSHASDAFRYLAITMRPETKINADHLSKSRFAPEMKVTMTYNSNYSPLDL